MELLNSRATMGIVHQFLHGGSGRQVAPVVLVAPLADSEPAALPATSPLPPPQPWCAATGWCPTGFRAGRPVLGRPSALGLESPGLLQSQPRPPPHRVPHAPPVRQEVGMVAVVGIRYHTVVGYSPTPRLLHQGQGNLWFWSGSLPQGVCLLGGTAPGPGARPRAGTGAPLSARGPGGHCSNM
jgi:hypothetical protein